MNGNVVRPSSEKLRVREGHRRPPPFARPLKKALERVSASGFARFFSGVKEAFIEKVNIPWSKRRTYMAAAVLGIVVLGLIVWGSTRSGVYQVVCDGQVLGYINDKTLLDQVLSRLMETEGMALGSQVKVQSKITLEKSDGKGHDIMNGDQLAEALKNTAVFTASGWVISVEGKDVVALATEEEARGVLNDLRQGYIRNLIEQGQATVEEVLIKEQIDIVQKDVPTTLFRNKSEAAHILARGTDKVLNYVVQRGDSLWSIAAANHMTVDDLRKANPQVQGDLIREGDNLNLVVPNPYVTLESKEVVTYQVSIPFSVSVTYDSNMWPWEEKITQYGKDGAKEITEVVVRENGKEVSRTRVSEKVISYPVVQKVVRGTKQIPQMGSGDLVWPVQGTITSKFGPRWGSFHQGVDIGASAGTPILAADSGVVLFAGWDGGYGYLVKLSHGNGMETWYAHMSKMTVSVGASVNKGQVIGYVGSTGSATGPHLHFEVHVNGVAKNPLNYYK